MVSLARAAPGPCGAFLWVDLDPHQSHGLMRGARGAVRLEVPPPPMLQEPLLPSPTPPTLYPFLKCMASGIFSWHSSPTAKVAQLLASI